MESFDCRDQAAPVGSGTPTPRVADPQRGSTGADTAAVRPAGSWHLRADGANQGRPESFPLREGLSAAPCVQAVAAGYEPTRPGNSLGRMANAPVPLKGVRCCGSNLGRRCRRQPNDVTRGN